VILAPKSFNLKANKLKIVNEFKLYGKQYIRCKALTKALKYTKQRSLYIWKWGEDIQLKSSTDQRTFFYCYIYKRLKHKQELCVVSSGRSTAMDHLVKDHQLDKVTGEIFSEKKDDPDQLIIEQYPEAKSLDLNRNFKGFKALLI
jgi:hypothetical protein